ncbi:MAG: hypothetical protein WCC27_15625 [Acidobacteriaceae bacterium]
MSRRFVSAQLKIDRAAHHIGDFNARRNIFLEKHPCRLRPHYDPQTDYTDYMVEDVTDIDSVISLVIGDAVHNLRSALDHLATALVRDNGQLPSKQTYFPICQSFSQYKTESLGKIKGMSVADQRGINLQKPYLGGKDSFWGLHRMDISDKHDLILTQTQCVEAINYRISDADMAAAFNPGFFGDSPSTEKKVLSVPLIGPLPVPEKGHILIRFPGNTEKNEEMAPSFDIAFRDVEVFKGRLVSVVLNELATLVQGTLNAFA